MQPALKFPHARQVARIVRQRRHGPTGRQRMQVEFVITDLTPQQANAAQLAALAREHWGIENRLHWVRDVTFAEDHSALRTGRAPAVMATLRNTAISLLRLAGHDNITATLAAIARHPERVLDLIDRPPHPRTSRDGRL